jgi:probable rRNA maturation factor
MATQSPLIEVTIQDYYFGLDGCDDGQSSDARATQPIGLPGQRISPISMETWESWFQQWLSQLQPEGLFTAGVELSLRLTDDAEIQSLNATYRHKDEPTDVLAFAALEQSYPLPDEVSQDQPLYLGDIVISVDTASRQAMERGHSLQTELAWLATHGLLHLSGWDHPDDDALSRMLQKQEELLLPMELTSNVV